MDSAWFWSHEPGFHCEFVEGQGKSSLKGEVCFSARRQKGSAGFGELLCDEDSAVGCQRRY